MPTCTNGGVPKSSTPLWLVLAATALEALLIRRFPWLSPFLSVLPTFAVDTSVFCAQDAPAMPDWTAGELAGLLLGQNQAKLVDTIHHAAWYEFCECAAPDPTPAAPFAPPPENVPVVQPNPVGTCDEFHKSTDVNSSWWFGGVGGGSVMTGGRPLPVGATHQTLSVQVVSNPGDDILSLEMQVHYGNSANSAFATRSFVMDPAPAPAQASFVADIPSGATQWVGRFVSSSSQSGPLVLVADVFTHCGGSPAQLTAPCCPPDPTLVAAVQELRDLVTLVQRQHVPFAYVPGLEYPGLSGSGSQTFSDPIVRLKLTLTTLPAWYGMAEGEPDARFDVGWIALGTADGYEPARRITHTPFLLQVPSDVTKIGWSLSPGIVAAIQTYSREP